MNLNNGASAMGPRNCSEIVYQIIGSILGCSALLMVLGCGKALEYLPPHPPQASFEVATVKQSAGGRRGMTWVHQTFSIRNESLLEVVRWAFEKQTFQVIGPEWMRSSTVDVVAKIEAEHPAESEVRAMLRTLLNERFKLVVHEEKRELNVTTMTLGNKAITFQPSDGEGLMEWRAEPGRAVLKRTTMAEFASLLSGSGERIYDMTDIHGRYDMTLEYAKYVSGQTERTNQNIVDGLREAATAQFGLVFRQRKVQVPILIIDHLDKTPIDN